MLMDQLKHKHASMDKTRNYKVTPFILYMILIFVWSTVGYASTLYVPMEYKTIQEAIDASEQGDTILVGPDSINGGPYKELIDFSGKAVIVKSEQGPAATTIDGNLEGHAVTFKSGEGLSSVLDGFTITHGRHAWGAGIYCRCSSPVIQNNIIIKNINSGYGGGGGGAIYCHKASPLILNNSIKANIGYFGTIYCEKDSCPSIMNNTIADNQAYSGGGIYSCSNAAPEIVENTIRGNKVSGPANGRGGGIVCCNSSPCIMGNLIFENTAESDGGGIDSYRSSPLIVNNMICGNSTGSRGGGMFWHGGSPFIANNTLTKNSAGQGGGLYCNHSQDTIILSNLVLWDNHATMNQEINASSSVEVEYSNVKGGFIGNGNIDMDPCFVDPDHGDFHLCSLSPCIDRGTSTCAPDKDMDGDVRSIMGSVDMGADEFIEKAPQVSAEPHLLSKLGS